jgi:hypothetical protein
MTFSYSDLNIRFYWRYPNASPVELKVVNPKTKLKEVLYLKTDKKDSKGSFIFESIKTPDPKRKHTLCTIEVYQGEEVLKEVTVKATKQKYIKVLKFIGKEAFEIKQLAPFIKEQGRCQSLRNAITELMKFPEIALAIDNDKLFRAEFWKVYNSRKPIKKDAPKEATTS